MDHLFSTYFLNLLKYTCHKSPAAHDLINYIWFKVSVFFCFLNWIRFSFCNRWHGDFDILLWTDWILTFYKFIIVRINGTSTNLWFMETRWCQVNNRTVRVFFIFLIQSLHTLRIRLSQMICSCFHS